MNISDLRENYVLAGLLESDVHPDPLEQFRIWFDQAIEAKLKEPNAMTLATASTDGTPSARIVLLKDLDEAGFSFYTNYESRKGQELAANPKASLVFYWAELERQVRINGVVEKVSREQTEAYFRTRPRGSRLGAWASRQSTPVNGREELEKALHQRAKEFGEEEIPAPEYWGGYRVIPTSIEFWQGRPNRLHDRLRYTRIPHGWKIERLSP